MKPIHRYFDLIHRIDKDTERLTAMHGEAIACRPGCTACCVNLTVFPVEFHAIRLAMTQAGVEISAEAFNTKASCGFLHKDLCRIYPFRPIICRTHGLPIVYLDETSGEYTWEVSFCEFNFTGCERLEFSDNSLLNIEDINSELSRINRDFMVSKGAADNKNPARVALKNLCY